LDEQDCGIVLDRHVSDLVDDDQPSAAELGQCLPESTLHVGVGQAGDLVGCGGEQDQVTDALGLGPLSARPAPYLNPVKRGTTRF
jgi:hypothetical protein